jgi:PAS domain S-box-containing protein
MVTQGAGVDGDRGVWFRAAFEQSPEGLALATSDGAWVEVNSTLCRWLGYERDRLLAISARAATVPHPTPFWRYTFADLIPEPHEPSRSVEQRRFEIPGRRGEWAVLDITVTRLLSPDGLTLGLLGRFADTRAERAERGRQEHHASERLRAMQTAAAGVTSGRLLLCAMADQLPERLPPLLAAEFSQSEWNATERSRLYQHVHGVFHGTHRAANPPARLDALIAATEVAADSLFEPQRVDGSAPVRLLLCGDGSAGRRIQVWMEGPPPAATAMLDGPSHAWREVNWMRRDDDMGGHTTDWVPDPPEHFARMVWGAERVWFWAGGDGLEEGRERVIVLETTSLPSPDPD